MTRIEPQALIEAFRATKKKPIRGDFVNRKGDGCCAMGVMAVFTLRPKGVQVDRFTIGFRAKDSMGLPEEYFRGFVCGWDDMPNPRSSSDPDFIQGFSDGKTAWLACVEEGLVDE